MAGILLIRKDESESLRPVQIVVNELSWVAVVAGVLAVVWSLLGKPRLWVGLLTGAVGATLAARPFLEYQGTLEDAASAMKVGLGRDYEVRIPADVQNRLLPAPLTLPNMLGKHLRDSRARLWRDLTYAQPQGIPLKLDVYEPMTKPVRGDSFPAIIVIHGGGWQNGDKQEYFETNNRYLANLGFVVFDIQYRLSTSTKWPAQLEDTQAAIQWVRDCASEYHVNPKQIALLGRSAGGHMALMAAMKADAATQVQAVIAFYSPLDMKFPNLTSASSIYNLIGGRFEDMPEAYIDATPLDGVRDDLPPLLIIDAKMDTIVPNRYHADKFGKRLAATNTPYVQIRVPWARHGFDAVTFGLGAQLVQYHMDRFLAYTFFTE